jgi:hypothetical protein
MNVTWPERDFSRRCPMCGFLASPGYPWEENLRPMTNCPRDGVPLERLACQSCGAPVVIESSRSFFSFGGDAPTPFCAYCGEPVTRQEPKMRERPASAQASPSLSTDSIIRQFAMPMGIFMRPEITIGYETLVAASRNAERRKAACTFKQARSDCRCAPCKSIRRHERKRR